MPIQRTLLRTPNYVLPQLPPPPQLGLPTPSSPLSPPPASGNSTPYSNRSNAPDSLLLKAWGVVSSLIWGAKGETEIGPLNFEPTLADEEQWPKELKKIAIIGVHGWFPIKLFQKVIGEPTGTSARFCSEMKDAILAHIRTFHPHNTQDPEIVLIPLEGDGKVLSRVARLHAALHARPDWIEALRTADCVFVATHSQGTPVSTILLSRLLEERVAVEVVTPKNNDTSASSELKHDISMEISKPLVLADSNGISTPDTASKISETTRDSLGISPESCKELSSSASLEGPDNHPPDRPFLLNPKRQRIGMLAMAGISHGPFPFLKSNLILRYFEADPARELFEFMDCPGDGERVDSSAGMVPAEKEKRPAELSRKYWSAMRGILDKGVKVTCIASMADQVVPLYSATMHALSHSNLLRAVYIDAPAAQEATAIAQTGHSDPSAQELPQSGPPSSDPAAATMDWERPLSRPSSRSSLIDQPHTPTASPSHPHQHEPPSPGDLDFLNNLIVFALRLRNAGLSDHGLVVHLSESVAGSFYGTGHSTIYEEREVYHLAFKWLFTPNVTAPTRAFAPDTGIPLEEASRKGVSGSTTFDRLLAPNTLTPGSRSSSTAAGAILLQSSTDHQSARDIPKLDLNLLKQPPASGPTTTTYPITSSSSHPLSPLSSASNPAAQQNRLPQTSPPISALFSAVPSCTPPISESQLDYFSASTQLNPYYLPWIIRALLGDPLVAANPELAAELQGIVRQFKDWDPKEKALRDLKYRLEPLKSHL